MRLYTSEKVLQDIFDESKSIDLHIRVIKVIKLEYPMIFGKLDFYTRSVCSVIRCKVYLSSNKLLFSVNAGLLNCSDSGTPDDGTDRGMMGSILNTITIT